MAQHSDNEMETREDAVSQSALNRRDRILLAMLTLSCSAVAASCWWYYGVEARATEAAETRTLFAIAEGKVRQIWNWRRERLGDGQVVMSDSTLDHARHILSDAADAAGDRKLIEQVFQRLSKAFLYSDAELVDLDGRVRLHLDGGIREEPEFNRERRSALAREANAAGDAVLSDLTKQTRSGRPLMALTIPVRQQGAIILDIDPERFLYPYIATWPGGAQTAETLMLRLEGGGILDLSRKRYAPQDGPLSRRPLTVKIPSAAVLDAGWSFEGLDYRGVRAFATVRHIPDSPWYLVVKVDKSEVTAPLRRLAWGAALLTGLIALVNTAGGALIVRRTNDRRHREREALFYSVANDTPAYLWMESNEGSDCFLNRPMREFLRSAPDDDPKSWQCRLHPDDHERVNALHNRARSKARGYSTEARICCFDGEYRVVLIDALPQYSAGRFRGFAGCLVDVTDRRRAEEQLRVANVDLQRELEDRIRRQEEIRRLGARLIDAREEERKLLARELHDGLNQQIAGVSIAIGNLKRNMSPLQTDARRQVDIIHERLVALSEDVRRVSHELHPALLSLRGLGAAVNACCDEFASAHHIEVSKVITGSFDDVPSPAALCVFRVVQEALQNVARHAEAGGVSVSLVRSPGVLELTVKDDGSGFEVNAAATGTGLGLISIDERVRLAGGLFAISSVPGNGTKLTVTIPLDVPLKVETEEGARAFGSG